ncbi:MAG: hypothetical protein JSS23_03075 [Proteobacteria bacterium]|nr:hypothetical protein [Pseudomonadota bacterium]
MIIPMMFAGAALVPGQQAWTFAGSYGFVVPANCYSIAAVAIGGGGGGAGAGEYDTLTGGAGGGGALSYDNAIAVTPGETLGITVGTPGAPGATMGDGSMGGESAITRSGAYLLRAMPGFPGNWSTNSGGAGAGVSAGVGAVRYGGNQGQDGVTAEFGYAEGGSSGGYSGGGQGADLYGNNGGPIGRGGLGMRGYSVAAQGNAGGVRIIWGVGRAFPGSAGDV